MSVILKRTEVNPKTPKPQNPMAKFIKIAQFDL